MSAIANMLAAPGVSLAVTVAVLLVACVLPSAARAFGTRASKTAFGAAVAERLLLALSIMLLLVVVVGYASRIEPGLGRILTLPAILLSALFAGRCVGRLWRDVRFLQTSIILGFAMSAAFVWVQQDAIGRVASAVEWRLEGAVVVGAVLAILVMHVGAALDARRRPV